MTKQTKDGWIRHRGGKCPIDAGTVIEYRERNGNIEIECKPQLLGDMWFHENNPHDIMAYRLHKPAEQVDGGIYAADDSVSTEQVAVSYIGESVQGPLQWRDRITEIDTTTQALTTERANLVQKLASEGFALIAADAESEGLPRRKWMVGDLVVRLTKTEESEMPLNVPMPITMFDGSNRGQDVKVSDGYWPAVSGLIWHSRPTN